MTPEADYRTPGQLIQDLIDRRGWTQRTLAIVLGADESGINKILAGKRPIDAEMALAISELLDVQAERLLDLQKSFDLAQARLIARPDPGRTTRANLFGALPVSEMIKRGWIDADDIRNTSKVESELTKFFRAESLQEIEILPHAAKKTKVNEMASPSQLAWLYRVKEIASEMLVPKYSPASVRAAVTQLDSLKVSAASMRKIPRILAEAGIRFAIVEGLTGSKIDGVCLWLNESSPVIALTTRRDRIDNFWFVLRHELEHVIQIHGQDALMLDAELEGNRAGTGGDISEEERVANQAAAAFCVPQKSMDSFIARKGPFFADRDIIGFARTLQIHPGLVAGQLQHRIDRHDRFHSHFVKVRSVIAPGAMVDGWGNVAPVGM